MNSNLKTKLSHNTQRRKAEEFYGLFPPDLQSNTSVLDIIYTDEYWNGRESPLPKYIDGQIEISGIYSDYQYWDTENYFDIISHIHNSKYSINGQLVLQIEDSPFFKLSQDTDQNKLLKLLTTAFSQRTLIVSNHKFSSGILIDKYCGYLPIHRSLKDHEIVYEFLYFKKCS